MYHFLSLQYLCKSHVVRPLPWRREWWCQLPEMHFIKIAVKLMLLLRMQGKDAFPELEVSSAEHPLPLFACFRKIFPFGIAHLKTNLWLSCWLTSSSQSTVSSFFFRETKLERVLQNQLVSLYCSLPGCCELAGFQAAWRPLASNLISEWLLGSYFLSMNVSLERQSFDAQLLSCRDPGFFAIPNTIVILSGK